MSANLELLEREHADETANLYERGARDIHWIQGVVNALDHYTPVLERWLVILSAIALVVFFGFGVAKKAFAIDDGWHAQVHGLTKHTSSTYDGTHRYNELNFGLGLRYAFNETVSIQYGAYRNSYDRTSVYAAADYTPLDVTLPTSFGDIQLGGFAALVTGYPYHDGGLMPAGGALARWSIGRWSLTTRVMPPIAQAKDGCVTLELGVRL